MDPGCYAVHMVRTLAGTEPEVVGARAKMRTPEVERAIRADLAFPNGVSGRVVSSLWSSELIRLSVRVIGKDGEMRVWNPLLPQIGHRITVRRQGHRRVERLSRRPTYAYQLDAFIAAVRDDATVLTDATDAVRTMTVVDAIYDAAGLPLRRPTVVPG